MQHLLWLQPVEKTSEAPSNEGPPWIKGDSDDLTWTRNSLQLTASYTSAIDDADVFDTQAMIPNLTSGNLDLDIHLLHREEDWQVPQGSPPMTPFHGIGDGQERDLLLPMSPSSFEDTLATGHLQLPLETTTELIARAEPTSPPAVTTLQALLHQSVRAPPPTGKDQLLLSPMTTVLSTGFSIFPEAATQKSLATRNVLPSGPFPAMDRFTTRVRAIRSQPKNLSPIEASFYASLLPPPRFPMMKGRKTLVLDLDETLVHSSYTKLDRYDAHLKLPVGEEQIDVFVAFRPFLREFLDAAAELFEVVIFTASVSIYCNPLMDIIDPEGKLGGFRLSREHCSYSNGTYIKDLSLLGRPLDHIAIVDNSPAAYLFQPRNAIPIPSWFDDMLDYHLLSLIPILQHLAAASTVYDTLDNFNASLQMLS